MNALMIAQIKRHEGFSDKPYKDTVGLLTIGYGRNLEHIGVSEEEAALMLNNDLKSALYDAKQFSWYAGLSEARKAVIVNMIFNMGIGRFKGFKKTIGYIENHQWDLASREMLDSLWAKQVGKRATELAAQLLSGEFI